MSPPALCILLSACVVTMASCMSTVDDVSPVASTVCRSFTSVAETPEARHSALTDALRAIDNAGSAFSHHARSDMTSLPSCSRFIETVRRLEYLSDQVLIYRSQEFTESDKLGLAETLLERGADSLPILLYHIHAAVVGSGITSPRSILAAYSDIRRNARSDYLRDTIQLAKELLDLQALGYTAVTWACSIVNDFSCFDHFSRLLVDRFQEQDAFLMRKRIHSFAAPSVQASFNWCSCNTCKTVMSDFNGDGRSDLMCFKSGGAYRMTTFDAASGTFRNQNSGWYSSDVGCEQENIYVGYFNHDGRSDVLCLEQRAWNDKMRIIYSTSSGRLESNVGWRGDHDIVSVCLDNPTETVLLTADFNGDGRTDILCQNHITGHVRITHRPTTPVLYTWRWTLPWCRTRTTRLYTGDFNGDHRADLLCHDRRTGRTSFKLAGTRGTFMTDASWRGSSSFCAGSSALYVGDFNGDRRSDLLCYTYRSNAPDTVKIIFANRSGDFVNSRMVTMDVDWCGSSEARLRQIADVNGDGRDDLICYDRNNQMRVSLNNLYLYF